MFKTPVFLLSGFSQQMIEKIIEDDSSKIDDTLRMTAIYLLYNRVSPLKVSSFTNNNKISPISLNPDVFSFQWFFTTATPETILSPVKNKLITIEKLPVQEEYLTNKLGQRVQFRIMPYENLVCIFAEHPTFDLYHACQFLIPKFFPIFKTKPVTKEETDFLLTLTSKKPDDYVQKISEFTNTESFKKFKLSFSLSAFEKRLFNRKVEAAKNYLSQIDQKMEQALKEYKAACKSRVDAQALIYGLEMMRDQEQEHTDLQDYLISNKRICNVEINDSKISFIAKTQFVPHYIEDWKTITQRRNYNSYETSEINGKQAKLLLDELFAEEPRLKLRMCAYFEMDYFGSRVDTVRQYDFISADKSLEDYVPNPHLQYHACMGQNKAAILEQLKEGDAIAAIECAITCAQRINIHEDATFPTFIRQLLSFKGKCFVTQDGQEMTPVEAIKYLEEN